jgi:hypothetical protein
LNWFKRSAALSFAFMVVEVDNKLSLRVSGGSAGCDFFKKNHQSLFASRLTFLTQQEMPREVV